jgi:hypothetical protein
MSRYKITYNKSIGFLSSVTWRCYIYDRKTKNEYNGIGKTRKEANDDAWDEVWKNKENDSSYSSSSYTNETADENTTSDFFAFPLLGGSIGLFISFIIAFYNGCGLFHFNPNKGNAYFFDIDDAKEGFLLFQ